MNPRLSFRVPKMDDKGEVIRLRESVQVKLGQNSASAKIYQIAHRLIASCFYFEKSKPAKELEDHYSVQGTQH
jgi:hypothetical protein